ncbi:hypothetical protein ACWC10_05975 [Streptomyces sp. NPDC001595]|uniref:hypothetical protein n=1 Tax=Streptomyces sp. NPDC001532 TaxID=3154520 RepID=UPI003322E9DF
MRVRTALTALALALTAVLGGATVAAAADDVNASSGHDVLSNLLNNLELLNVGSK